MKRGFTLAEVIISLLVVVIVMVLTLPILTKKAQRDLSQKIGQPWKWIGNTANAKFNSGGSSIAAIIGMNSVPSENNLPRLIINTGSNNTDHIQFNQGGTKRGALTVNSRGYFLGNYPKVNRFKKTTNAAGTSTADADPYNGNVANTVAIGDVLAYGSNSVTIGKNTKAFSKNSVAIGTSATVAECAVAIGTGTNTCAHCTYNASNYTWVCKKFGSNEMYNYQGNNAVAIGHNAKAYQNSIAIGAGANAYYVSTPSTERSLAMGYGSTANASSSFVIGNQSYLGRGYASITNTTLIAHNTSINVTNASNKFNCKYHGSDHSIEYSYKTILGGNSNVVLNGNTSGNTIYVNTLVAHNLTYGSYSKQTSDLRLKNLSSEFTSGMDKLNKLKIYNYTFKSNPNVKRVGVTAQELMKIFPDAVSKDENGYYTIRHEDIFYSMVNALKDFDKKIKNIITSISNINKDLSEMELKVKELSNQTEKNAEELKLLKQRVKILETKINSQKKVNCEVKQ